VVEVVVLDIRGVVAVVVRGTYRGASGDGGGITEVVVVVVEDITELVAVVE
jgi:hypothetical protein